VADALTAGEQTVGKLLRGQPRIPGDVLEPLHAIARGALQLEHFHVALFMVRLERLFQTRAAGDVAAERYSIFHGEFGAGPDGEMGRVRGISDEHDLAIVPVLAAHQIEVEPRRPAQVSRIAP